MRLRGLALVLAFSIPSASISSARAAEPAPEARLIETDRAFSALSAAKGAASAFATYMAPDALSLPAGGLPEQGRDAIVEGLKAGDPKAHLTWAPQAADVAASGDLGFTWGFYRLTAPAADGTAKLFEGKYVTIWRKEPDGQWRAILDTGNANPRPGSLK